MSAAWEHEDGEGLTLQLAPVRALRELVAAIVVLPTPPGAP